MGEGDWGSMTKRMNKNPRETLKLNDTLNMSGVYNFFWKSPFGHVFLACSPLTRLRFIHSSKEFKEVI